MVARRGRTRTRVKKLAAGQVLFVLLLSLVLAGLFSAEKLRARAEALPYGPGREVVLVVVQPIHRVSTALGLDGPARAVAELMGRGPSAQADGETRSGTEGERGGLPRPGEPALGRLGDPAGQGCKPASSAGPGGFTQVGGSTHMGVPAPALSADDVPAGPEPADDSPANEVGPKVSAERPLTVWVCGDSIVLQVGVSLESYATNHAWVQASTTCKISSGLSRPDFYNWPGVMAEKLTELDPDVVVAMFGGNDAQGLLKEGKALQTFSEEWNAEYASRAGAAMDLLGSRGARVIWLGGPIKRSTQLSAETEKLNRIYRAEAEQRGHVTFIDSWALFSDESGRYTSYLVDHNGKRRHVREPDGEHLTLAGGDRMAAEILKEIRHLFEVEG